MRYVTILLAFTLINCSPLRHYSYYYQLVEPVVNDELSFEDGQVSIDIMPSEHFINILIENKTSDSLTVLWDDIVVTMKNRRTHTFRRQEGNYYPLHKQLPTVILPGGKLEEDLVPAHNILKREDY